MSDSTPVLFDRLGGTSAVAEIVQLMYERVLADPELAPFFEGASMERLRQMQYHFLASAFDGPAEYSGAELTKIHAGRGINAKHFAKFCGHFADVLDDREVDKRDINAALGRLAMFRDKITGDANVDG
ncbi:group I truncated hemoglobin [Rhodopirellula sp. MGV]|uniref:group I truncated hemoglobin n=1 Tax=Rhodopirellula sp. MGV TaxID=2023130 RepID=UPI000B971010|nr:group 1 truncated hemoglobin [Rhodopirellula sp. MGV]OYP28218.1 hemin transporter [Rhodopirellula sp. MGV]PNY34387.1 group 1 truncated hemoglobin [Rhodopirellula baltica]